MTCATCLDLLNEALNLAARSDQIEEQRRREAQLAASMDPKAWQESGRYPHVICRLEYRWQKSDLAGRDRYLSLGLEPDPEDYPEVYG